MVDAGHDAGTDAGSLPAPCDEKKCADTTECRVDASDAGVCEPSYEGIQLVSPDGGLYGPDASVAVEAVLMKRSGFAGNAPTALLLQVNGGAPTVLAESGVERFTTALQTGLLAEGPHVVRVSLADGGLPVEGGFRVDRTGPAFAVVASVPTYGTNLPDAYYPSDPEVTGAYRRDDRVTVEVTSSADDVDVGTVQLEVGSPTTGGTHTFTNKQPCSSSAMPFCQSFTVDLSKVPFEALRGDVSLVAKGADVRGNPQVAPPGTPTLKVTRWRWALRLSNVTVGAIGATPALTRTGNIAVAVASGAGQGLTMVAPDAGVLWRVASSTSASLASPSVGTKQDGSEWVFFQQGDNGQSLVAAQALDGGLLTGCGASLGSSAGASPLSPTLVGEGTDEVGVVGTQPRSGGMRVVAYRPFSMTSSCYFTSATGGSFPGNVVTDGIAAYYPDTDGKLTKLDVQTAGSLGAATQIPGTALGIGVVNGLALFASGTQLAGGGGGGPGIGALFQLLPSGVDAGVVSGTPVTAPVITAAGDVIAGFRTASSGGQVQLQKHTSAGVMLGTPVATGASFPIGTPGVSSPVLGEGDGLYVVASTGYLVAANQSSLAVRYEGALFPSGSLGAVSASPTLDCNRERSGTQTGVLYFATEMGYLVSVIVDSKGLDSTAQWPKYQRDAQNSGNVMRGPIPSCP